MYCIFCTQAIHRSQPRHDDIIIYGDAVQFENRRVRNLFFAQSTIGQKLFSSSIKSYGLLYIYKLYLLHLTVRDITIAS